jgi:hypothetical protein
MKGIMPDTEHEVHVHVEEGAVERVPIPVCPQDEAGWYSQGARQQLVLFNNGPMLGMWVTDQAGRSVARPRMDGDEITLEFRPWGGRSYYLNFILPAGEQQTEFDLKLSLLCYEKALTLGTGLTVPFNPDEVESLVELTLTAAAPTWTATPTATHRPWPTLTLTPTITPYVPVNCAQYKTKDSCEAEAACRWVLDFAGLGTCQNR